MAPLNDVGMTHKAYMCICMYLVSFLFLIGSLVKGQSRPAPHERHQHDEQRQQTHANTQGHQVGNGFRKLLVRGGKFVGDVQVSAILYA